MLSLCRTRQAAWRTCAVRSLAPLVILDGFPPAGPWRVCAAGGAAPGGVGADAARAERPDRRHRQLPGGGLRGAVLRQLAVACSPQRAAGGSALLCNIFSLPAFLPFPNLLLILVPAPQELDKKDALHRDYWAALALVAERELFEVQKQEDIDRAKCACF